MDTERQEGRNKARALAIEAIETWTDQYEGYEGAIVTGWLLVAETTVIGRPPFMTWMTGNGAEPQGVDTPSGVTADMGTGPLPMWRVRGLAGQVIAELDGLEAQYQRARFEEAD